MHIPSMSTDRLELLSFADAFAASGKSGAYDCSKWLYIPDFYTEYRYILGTKGARPLICIGVNPSTAEPNNLDNTLKSVARIAAGNGYDSWIMFNVYAQRATRPDDMDRELNLRLHMENMKAFEYILAEASASAQPAIWAAWGAVIEKRKYLPDCVRDMVQIGMGYNARWYSAGKCSKAGHPHHPLYLRKDEKTQLFDIDAYLSGLENRGMK